MLIYIDLKTTGFEQNDRICSIAFIVFDEDVKTYRELIKAPKKIRPEASAVHHITNEMLKEKSSFQDSKIANLLREYNNPKNIFIGHNIALITAMLQKEDFILHSGIIDTLRCSRALIQECEQFSLQFLRYELKLYKDEESAAKSLGIHINAHEALSDALHVRLLHLSLNEFCDDEKLMEFSANPVLLKKLNFGKYKGHFLEEIAMNDKNYLLWMLGNLDSMDEDLRYSIDYYLKMI